MPRKTKHEIHQQARSEFEQIHAAYRDERLQCLQDRRFYSIPGAQWEGPLGEQFENRPKFEVNKIHLSIIRIINEYRNNRISVDFKNRGGKQYDSLSDTCDLLYRADEIDSTAEEAYDNAFEEGASGGFGAWRLRAEYEDDEDPGDDRQRIRMEPIFDADSSVFFDLQAKRQDKSDAKKCFVLSSMTIDAFKEEYDEDPASWPKEIHQNEFDWFTPDVVFIAEYYTVELTKQKIYVWQTLDGAEKRFTEEELEEEREILEATGAQEVRIKTVKKRRVRKYIMSGNSILEDCGYIAGSNIPIVPVYGKRWFIDNVERCQGHTRLSKDSQRLKNMQLSKLGEISALGSVEKPIVTPDQIAGHQQMWTDDNLENYPYLLLNPMLDQSGNEMPSAPLAYTKTASVPQALAALLQLTEDDLNGLLGNTQNSEEISGNVSTETAHLIQNRLDMQTFIYLSNFKKSMRRSGEIWLSMAKDIYVEPDREMEGMTEEGGITNIILNRKQLGDDGEIISVDDLSNAKMKIFASVGPSSSTRRLATVRALTDMLEKSDDPETRQVLSAMIMMNMEGEGIEEVRQFFRFKLIRLGVVKPTDEEAKQLREEQENTPPNPQDEYFKAAAGKEQAEAVEKQANTILKQAQADKTRMDTLETAAKIENSKTQLAVDTLEKLGPRVEPPSVPGSAI